MSDYDRLLEIAPPANTFAPGTTVPQNSVDEAAATMALEAQPASDYDRLLQIAPPNADMDTMLTGMHLAKSAIGLATLPLSLPSPEPKPVVAPSSVPKGIKDFILGARSGTQTDVEEARQYAADPLEIPYVTQQEGKLKEIAAAIANAGIGGANFALSPAGPPALALGSAPATIGKLALTLMSADQAAHGILGKTLQEKLTSFLGAGLTEAGALAHGGVGRVEEVPQPPAPENVAPRMAAARTEADANQQAAIAQMLRQRGNLPPVKGVTARFQGFEPGSDPTSQANLTRDILARNKPLQAEAQRLALQLKQAPGMAGRRIIQDRIDAINQEMARPLEVAQVPDTTPETVGAGRSPLSRPSPVAAVQPSPVIRPQGVDKLPSAEPPASEPPAQVGAEPTGMSNKAFAAVHGEGAVPSGQGRSPTEWKAIGDRRLLVDNVDPYAVLTKGRQQGNVLPPEDVALLGAEHRRLVADAKQSEGTPQWDQKSQFAADYARAIQPFKTSASSVFHSLQETYEPTFDSLTDFDQHIRHRLGREMTPEEKTGFSQAASDVRESKNGATTEASAAVERVRKYRPKETMSFDEASKSLGEQISELTKDCIL